MLNQFAPFSSERLVHINAYILSRLRRIKRSAYVLMQTFPAHSGAVCTAIKEAAALFSDSAMLHDIRQKSAADFVTQVDVCVQEFLKERLHEIAPGIQFMGEEQSNAHLDFQQPLWILDPVDGTTNLIHDFRYSAISLALANQGEVAMAWVYNPYSQTLFSAEKGKGAYANATRIHVTRTARLSDSLIAVGTTPGCREHADDSFARMRRVFDHCHDIRRLGSAALELCDVASGRMDGFFEAHLKPWDFAAGLLIVAEAGGTVRRPDGTIISLQVGGPILATNGIITDELLALLA